MNGAEFVEPIIGATLHGDVPQAVALLDALAAAGGDAAVYGLSAIAAEIARVLLLAHHSTVTQVRAECQRRCEAAAAGGDPHKVFAARFTAACVHDDQDMAEALFVAAAAAGTQTRNRSVAALLAHVADVYRTAPTPPHQGGTRS